MIYGGTLKKTRSSFPEGHKGRDKESITKAGGFVSFLRSMLWMNRNTKIDFTTKFPFGITGFNHLTTDFPIQPRTKFRLAEDFSPVVGLDMGTLRIKQLHDSVADSLARLKRCGRT